MGWLRRAVVDLRPLRRREFRLLFGAQAVSLAGFRTWGARRPPTGVAH